MNYKKLNDWNSGFHNWVLIRHPHEKRKQNGFMGGFIFGKRGSGKSTYCYKLQAKIYYTLNGYYNVDNEEDAYKQSLKYMLFDPVDFRSLLIKNKIKGDITPVVTLDDASMHFGNTLHQTDAKLYAALRAETATIRTAITGFLINAPKRDHVAKCLRDYDDYKGESMRVKGPSTSNEERQTENWERKIRFYEWRWYPDEKKYNIKIPFQDKYSCYVPEPFYSWYTTKKNYFEIKYEVNIADRIDPSTREIFIILKNDLPSYKGQPNLKGIVEKWEKEEEDEVIKEREKLEKERIGKVEWELKKLRVKEKLQNIKEQEDEIK